MADVGRPAVYNDPGILQATIEEYFAQEGKKTITGLAYHLGFESRQSSMITKSMMNFLT
jgi:hypothetical protein